MTREVREDTDIEVIFDVEFRRRFTELINPSDRTAALTTTRRSENVPSMARVAAGALGFLTFIQVFEGPERYGAFSFFETIPSSPSLQIAFEHLPAVAVCSTC